MTFVCEHPFSLALLAVFQVVGWTLTVIGWWF